VRRTAGEDGICCRRGAGEEDGRGGRSGRTAERTLGGRRWGRRRFDGGAGGGGCGGAGGGAGEESRGRFSVSNPSVGLGEGAGSGSTEFFLFFLTITIRADAVAFACKFPATTCLVSKNDSGLMWEAAGSTSPGASSSMPVRGLALTKPAVEATPFVSFDLLFPVESQ
jgi:hypothetical protein